jgi:hypothetical protein|tara:strand:- start:446 stop:691 length:246 start_codon:yes stop_codon:yes gene_type:complete
MTKNRMRGPPFDSSLELVKGGGIRLMTADVFVKAAVWRCRVLEIERDRLIAQHHADVGKFRTLRRDVNMIKRALAKNLGLG